MNEYDFRVSIFGNANISVIAENQQEAQRILNETMESINIKDLRLKETTREDVSIKDSDIHYQTARKVKDKDKER